MATDFPDDLLIEILSRLPVKSLVRFRSVSKSFKYLLSTPQFISSHIASTSNHHPKVLVRRSSPNDTVSYKLCLDNPTLDKISDLDFPFACRNDFFTMIGCVDGLVCLSDDFVTHTDTLFLWNPILRRSLPLPPPSVSASASASASVVLGFGPSSSDYKLVRIVYYMDDRIPISAEVYRLRSGEWGGVGVPETRIPQIRGRQANVNGYLHWLAEGDHRENVIVRFDLEKEEFDTRVGLPSGLGSEPMKNLTIAAWGKSLAVFQVEYLGSLFSMWVREEEGGCWTQRFVVESFGMLRRIRSLRRSGEVVFEASGNRLVVFDPQTKGITQCLFQVEGALSAFHMRSYSESLLLLDHKDALSC